MPANARLSLTVSLRERHTAVLASFIRELNTPGSPEYGHPLRPAQFIARFAPTPSHAFAVVRFLRRLGFREVTLTRNRLFVTARATAAEAEQAFGVHLADYAVGARTIYANTDSARVPSSLGGTVLSVLGLNDAATFSLPVRTRVAPGAPTRDCELNPALPGEPDGFCFYTPSQFRTAYDAGGLNGSGTAIAIMAEGNLTGVLGSLRTAETSFGEPRVPYTIVHVGRSSGDTSGAREFDLDSQYATAMAPNVSHLYLYDTPTLSDGDIALELNRWASEDVAKAASASFGECERAPYEDGLMLSGDQVLSEAAAQGQTLFAAAGDSGGQQCEAIGLDGLRQQGLPELNYPCSSGYAVCVGGTSLFTNDDGSYEQEFGWTDSGGGTSRFEPEPAWQSCVFANDPGMLRETPDVSMDADVQTGAPVYVLGTSLLEAGGTSLSAPLALGAWADIESADGNSLGFAAPLLYGLYPRNACDGGQSPRPAGQLGTAATEPGYPLHDLYLGGNGAYPATFGSDYATGLGSLDVLKVAAALAPASPPTTPPAPPPSGSG